MDYVVGSVAALISGNVTPNRPKLIRKALTPTKHQPSPNVTPKSELQVDRSIFLSPTLQKKKAIVKKSPKRIFQNPELDTTENEEDSSPKADKVKKHLEDDLEADAMGKSNKKSPKKRQDSSLNSSATFETSKTEDSVVTTESSPKKKKKSNSDSKIHVQSDTSNVDHAMDILDKKQSPTKSPKKKNQNKSVADTESSEQNMESTTNDIMENTEEVTNSSQDNKKKKMKKRKNKNSETNNVDNKENKTEIIATQTQPTKKKKNKKNKNKNKQQNEVTDENKQKTTQIKITTTETIKKSRKKIKKQSQTEGEIEINETETTMEIDNEITQSVNPNAITEQDSDSEHESDDEIHSDNEETNKELLESQENNENSDESDDDDDEQETKKQKLSKKEQKDKKKKDDGENIEVKEKEINIEDEVKKTVFVGNVLLTKKTRKEIKKIFRKYGEIKTVRIRFVPVKDARVTPKMAVIKNELHPERSTVNVYVKFADEASVEQALAENNTVLNGHHLRVTRTTSTGAEHDPRLAVFVGNMPFGMEDDQLRGVFEKCGEIESVRIIRDKKTNAGKGFGYVNFTSKDGVELALNLSEEDLTVKNRIMRVKRSTQVSGQKGPGQNKPPHNKPGQNRPPHNRPGQNRPPQNRPPHNRPGQNRPGQNRPPQNRPGQNRPGQSRPWQNRPGQNEPVQESEDGAHRRIMNKRKYQESGDGPPNKVQKNVPQPNNRENKKQRKEFVGMTSEKKKKHKFDKGQKKKKVLSEILTKKRS